ncbi:hypothetical protein F5148DRAFT_1148241 [Russula earlei]|uniref:Uncharacterized protein n=1 Tax=Russula earlei TaxID=71964 RepID=A0ACC0UD90_9AGAM|nr:hypothetical protein F5148DRAFT_1148241 [Russula earlei]
MAQGMKVVLMGQDGLHAIRVLSLGIGQMREKKKTLVMLDNASNNNATCETIKSFHHRRGYQEWRAKENQFPCLEHVVNLTNVAMMSHIAKISAVETATAIWEYDPDSPDNHVLGGSLDVIAAVHTITIKAYRDWRCVRDACEILKLQKYYSCFDEKPIYVLALVLHPYYKLDYIEMAWGGTMEQAVEWRNGNVDAKNWQLEMEQYHQCQPRATQAMDDDSAASLCCNPLLSEFDWF